MGKDIERAISGFEQAVRVLGTCLAGLGAAGLAKRPDGLAGIMRGLAHQGVSVSIHIDDVTKRFTLTSSDGRTCDTGCPYEELVYWWGDKQREIDKEYNARPRSGEIDWDVVHKSKLE